MPLRSLRGRPFRALYLLALVACLGIAAGTPAQASPRADNSSAGASGDQTANELTFGVRPATATQPDDSRTYFSWAATPRAVVEDHIAIVNYSDRAAELTVYATDAINTDQGGFGLLPTSEAPKDAGSWITVKGAERPLTVPARSTSGPGTVILPVAVSIPAKASPGDHSGGILAVLTSIDRSPGGPAVKLEQRVGTRVFVQVAGDLSPKLQVTDLTATYHGSLSPVDRGSATVSYTLRNTGNVNLGATAVVEVAGLLGTQQVEADPVELLLPGSSVDVVVSVPDVLPTVWKTARVTVKPQSMAGSNDPPPAAFSDQVAFWAIPWTLLAIVVLLLLVGVAWWVRRTRGGRGRTSGKHSRNAPKVSERVPA
ncbi:MAG: DUF916 domain-containing protein [Actinomycetes bacterium]